MAFCPACFDDEARTTTVDVSAEQFGLPSGTLRGILRVDCDCGEVSHSIPAHGAVIKRYREQLARLDRPLSADEYGYLRRALRLSGQQYAAALQISNVTVSRAENGAGFSTLQEAILRALTLLDLEGPGVLAHFLEREHQEVTVDARKVERSRYADLSDGWQFLEKTALPSNVVPMRKPRSLTITKVHTPPAHEPVEIETPLMEGARW